MSTVIALFAPELSAEEVSVGAHLLQETHPNDELWCWLDESAASTKLDGRTQTYRELPSPADWKSESVSEVVYFGSDPRFFTAPRFIVPGSHGIDTVSYEIAQELIGFFNPQLTPQFISQLASADLPLSLLGLNGATRVEHPRGASLPAVRSIVVKRGVLLLSISTTEMWKQAGFLGKIFTLCADHGISVDQVSASEAEVTLTLDGDREHLPADRLEKLLASLNELGSVILEEPCTVVTLVGRRIRSILSQLAPVLGRFEEERVFLISQSASDCNLTFVVEAS